MGLDRSSVDDDDSTVRRGQTVYQRDYLTSRPLTNVDLVDHIATFLWLALLTIGPTMAACLIYSFMADSTI